MTVIVPRGMRRASVALAALVLVVVACGGEGGPAGLPGVSPSPAAMTLQPTPNVMTTVEGGESLCAAVTAVDEQLVSLRAVPLRLPNRVRLDIELGKLQALFADLEETDAGELEEQLDAPRQRLHYRLGELELAVEDFRTNSRIRRAVPHVEEDAKRFADELGAFIILSRC